MFDLSIFSSNYWVSVLTKYTFDNFITKFQNNVFIT
jgi:hypothetical protein